MKKRVIWAAGLWLGLLATAGADTGACSAPVSVCDSDPGGRALALVRQGRPVSIYVDADADPAIRRAARTLASDLERVSGRAAPVLNRVADLHGEVVIIGVPGRSAVLDQLAARRLLKADDLRGQWEAFRQAVVDKPLPSVTRALVIAGSDRRGAVFGVYDLSSRMGVSPWVWWADVPVTRRPDVFVKAGERRDQPQVKYRGIFINDEAPAFSTWSHTRFGGANSAMYEHVFELMLRLKANYLWPAMWPPRAFYADDPRNMVLADEMGIVVGTSHHEPMTRAHDEWARFKGGAWDYGKNAAQLRQFWRGGIERLMSRPDGSARDTLVTVGMRGDGDEPMSEDTATSLLETIVSDQRKIIAEVTRQPAEKTPQMWALYKEVQDYYDKGMKVPDDVLLLFCDDNWGQLRRLPERQATRAGGYGIYYHFDYVGGPRSYKWLNTNQIEKTWQQMNLAHEHGANGLWIVNVGDIKPMEFPISFFLDMAWAPGRMSAAALAAYPADWAAKTFGQAHAAEIGEIVTRYSQYAARRKPELVDPQSFALGSATPGALDGGDFGRRVAEWDRLEARMRAVRQQLRADQLDAYFQLVEHPVAALANLYRLYYTVAWNRKLAASGDPRANVFADRAEAAFKRDQELSDQYHQLGGGKWVGMMSQTHIGYTSWNEPKTQVMPAITRVAGSADAAEVDRQLAAAGQPARVPGLIELEAGQFSRSVAGKSLAWTAIPNLGHTAGAVTALPQGRAATTRADDVRLEYEVQTDVAGEAVLELHMVPTLDTAGTGAVRLAVAIDDQPAQELRLALTPATGAERTREEKDWAKAVRDNKAVLSARFARLEPGRHVIRLWRLDDNAVVQRLVLDQRAATQRRTP